jgi:hypothetical protein
MIRFAITATTARQRYAPPPQAECVTPPHLAEPTPLCVDPEHCRWAGFALYGPCWASPYLCRASWPLVLWPPPLQCLTVCSVMSVVSLTRTRWRLWSHQV